MSEIAKSLLLLKHNDCVVSPSTTEDLSNSFERERGPATISCDQSDISTASQVDENEGREEMDLQSTKVPGSVSMGHDQEKESGNADASVSSKDAPPKYNYKDHASSMPREDETETIASKVESSNRFPFKLHQMLSHPEFRDVVMWLPHGRSFKILNRKRMEEHVLPCFFESANYNSFVRLLNAWQFRRKRNPSTDDKTNKEDDFGSYYHELFLRTKPHLLQQMQRLPRYNGKKLPMDDKSEPDFSLFPSLPMEDNSCALIKKVQPLKLKSKKRKDAEPIDSPYAAFDLYKFPKKISSPRRRPSGSSNGSRSNNLPLSGSTIPLSVRLAAAASLFGIKNDNEETMDLIDLDGQSRQSPETMNSDGDEEEDMDEEDNLAEDEAVLVEEFQSHLSSFSDFQSHDAEDNEAPTSPKRPSSVDSSASASRGPSMTDLICSPEKVRPKMSSLSSPSTPSGSSSPFMMTPKHNRSPASMFMAAQEAESMRRFHQMMPHQSPLGNRQARSHSSSPTQPVFVVVPVSDPSQTQNAIAAAAANYHQTSQQQHHHHAYGGNGSRRKMKSMQYSSSPKRHQSPRSKGKSALHVIPHSFQ